MLITGMSSFVTFHILKRMLSKAGGESNWNLGGELLYHLVDVLLIGFWNALYVYLVHPKIPSFASLLFRIEGHTLLIGIIPVVVFVYYKNSKFLKQQLERTLSINEILQKKPGSQASHQLLELHSEHGKFEIRLETDNILFIRSYGNYLEVFYIDQQGREQKYLMRNRLKTIHGQLPKSNFFHCHKSYLINLSRVLKASGNARELRLSLRGSDQLVPVSRSKSKELLAFLNRN